MTMTMTMTRQAAGLLLCAALCTASCGDVNDIKKTADQGTTDSGAGDTGGGSPDLGASGATRVKMVTSMGEILLELNPDKAPKSVANFLTYVKAGFYDGTLFHRVISTFMIQGGGYTASMTPKATNPPIINEADNGLSNLTGTIAMARTSVPDSATSQFFINVTDNAGLDFKSKTTTGWGYAVFGKVIQGMDTVNKITAVKTTTKGAFEKVPITDVVIQSAKVAP